MDEIRQERMATFERSKYNYILHNNGHTSKFNSILCDPERSKDLSNQLDIERRRHEEIVALLKQDNARLEEFAENQQDQVLKLEEEKSQVTGVLKELKYELESERKSHEVEVNILSRKLENAENEVAKLEEEQRLLREDFEVKFLSARAKAETDISTLQGNLQSAISDQNALQKEISELKGKLETQKRESLRKSSSAIAMLENKHKEQSRAIKERHTAVVEKLQEKLNASVKRERSIKHKLEKSSGELKALLDQLHEKEDSYEKQISTLEASNVKYLAEVSQLKTDCTKLQGEISQMKTAAIAYKNKISSLKAELQRESDFEDYPSLPISSRRSSTSSESSRHGEIISKMKLQLEELQNVLETKSANGQQTGEISEFELINKLIANSSALDAEVQKMRRGISAERLAHLQICAQKDENFYGLQVENETQQKLIKGLTLKVSEEINSKMNTLQSECSHFILGCRTKLDGVMLQLATIAKSLKDANLQHSTEISTLSTNLDQSRNEIQIYRDKLDRLHLELETTRHNLSELSESQDQLIRIQQDKDLEMDELRSRLEQIMEINHSVDVERAPTTFFGNIKVDADSGQVIADHEEAQTREELLLLKEETILSLRNELEQLKEAERHVRVLNEEANRKLIEREREMKKTKQEAEILRIKTAELESKLKQQSLEVRNLKNLITAF